jgi:hypothetical protein
MQEQIAFYIKLAIFVDKPALERNASMLRLNIACQQFEKIQLASDYSDDLFL